MLLLFLILNTVFSFNINIINTPFDRGANIKGSRYAFYILKNDIMNSNLNIKNVKNIECHDIHIRKVFTHIYRHTLFNLEDNKLSLQVGGDHSIAIPSIYASNNFCQENNKKLGIIWFDAHADFNTMNTSPSGNIHGVPISVLCGHTLPFLTFGEPLDTNQFAYYGIRDIDTLEFQRLQDYNMLILNNKEHLNEWIKNFDKIHISFDLDCLDPKIFWSINTPVENGLTFDDIYPFFEIIKESGKLQSVDLVEYNPLKGKNNNIIINILEKMLI
jgi:arginase